MSKKTYMLRTCDKNMKSWGGFVWPKSGPVLAPDWNPEPICGGGLHGLLLGCGDGRLLSNDPNSLWLVVEVDSGTVVDLAGKVKVPSGSVVFCGDREGALLLLEAIAPECKTLPVVLAIRTAGDYGTATAGDYGTATAGDSGTATAGDYGTATAGDYGTATAGDYGTATAGDYGTLQIKWFDGRRYRIATAYTGENGIKPNTKYRVDNSGAFVEVG